MESSRGPPHLIQHNERKVFPEGVGEQSVPVGQDITDLDKDECNRLFLMYLQRIHIFHPFITIQSLREMRDSWLQKKKTSTTSSDVLFLLIIALGAIVGQELPLPALNVDPIKEWSDAGIAKAIEAKEEAFPGLNYVTRALAAYDSLPDIVLLHDVQVHLLWALYADQIMLVSTKHRHIYEACKRCIWLVDWWRPAGSILQ
jgi:hypothetical protein